MSHKFDAPPIGPFAGNCVYVDGASGSDREDGTFAHPYKTIQGALDAKPIPATAAAANSPWVVRIESGYYPENLTIPTTGAIVLHGNGGVVKLGSAAPTANNITYAATAGTYGEDSVLELHDFYTMGTITVSCAAVTASLQMRDSLIGVALTGTGIFDPDYGVLDVRDSTIASMDFNGGVIIDRCSVTGTCSFTTATRLESCTFTGAVTSTGAVGVIRGCTFAALATFAANGPTVYQSNFVSVTVVDNSCNFFNCLLNGTFDGPVSSCRVNGVTGEISTVALTGGATMVYIGGGGSTGETVTLYHIASLASLATTTIVHPAVSMTYTSEQIEISAWRARPGSLNQSWRVGFPTSGITFDDKNVSNRTFTRTGSGIGNFSGAVDPGVQVGCRIYIGISVYDITVLTGDGTAAGSVTLTGSPGSIGVPQTVIDIDGLRHSNGFQINYTPHPIAYFYTFEFITPNLSYEDAYPSGGTIAAWDAVIGMFGSSNYNHGYPGYYSKWVISNDDGVTWYYYNNVAWTQFDGDVTNGADWANAPTLTPLIEDTLDAAAAVDATPEVTFPSTAHHIQLGMQVTIAGTTNYNGTHLVVSVTTDTFNIVATYAAETFAGTETVTFGPPQGMIDRTGQTLYDSTNTTKVYDNASILATMPVPSGTAKWRVRGAVITDGTGTPYGYVWRFSYNELDTRSLVSDGRQGVGYGDEQGELTFERISTTEIRVGNITDGGYARTFTEITVAVKTP